MYIYIYTYTYIYIYRERGRERCYVYIYIYIFVYIYISLSLSVYIYIYMYIYIYIYIYLYISCHERSSFLAADQPVNRRLCVSVKLVLCKISPGMMRGLLRRWREGVFRSWPPPNVEHA